MTLLVQDLHAGYGKIEVVHGLDLRIEPGEVVALIGNNGAGKTTTLRTLVGQIRPTGGTVDFYGEPITAARPADLVRRGIALVPEGRRIFPTLTVTENLLVGGYARGDRNQVRADLAAQFARFPRLYERRAQAGGTLSGGEQQMLAIARALMSRPRLLLLDEPSMGLAPRMVEETFRLIADLRETGAMVLLVEQNARMALGVADRGLVMEMGRLRLEGTADELRESPAVIDAYLGVA